MKIFVLYHHKDYIATVIHDVSALLRFQATENISNTFSGALNCLTLGMGTKFVSLSEKLTLFVCHDFNFQIDDLKIGPSRLLRTFPLKTEILVLSRTVCNVMILFHEKTLK